MIPTQNGIYLTLSSRIIDTGVTIFYDKHCRVSFGAYVQVHKPNNNSLMPRTSGAIAL